MCKINLNETRFIKKNAIHIYIKIYYFFNNNLLELILKIITKLNAMSNFLLTDNDDKSVYSLYFV